MPDANDKRVILLVGHCGPDAWMLTSAARRAAPDHEIQRTDSDAELRERIDEAALLLVNRVLDGAFADESGLALIERLAAADAPPMMLVSNFPDAQAEAVRAGALPGFGKRELNTPETLEKIAAALDPSRLA